MKFLNNLNNSAKSMKRQLTSVYYAYHDKRVKKLPKVIIGIAIVYALSPIDLIPDFIPILGLVDDLIIIPALIALAIKLIPKEIMDEARKKADEKPIKLGKNWMFATVFISIWIVMIYAIVSGVIKLIKGNA